MPRYRYIGADERIFQGLSHGPDAIVSRTFDPDTDDHPLPASVLEGSTVVLRPGDHVTTSEPYVHALLAPIDDTDDAGGKPRRGRKPKTAPTDTDPSQDADPAANPTDTTDEPQEASA